MSAGKVARSALVCAGLALLGALGPVSADALRPPALNAKPEARIPGKFIWFDFVTDDTYGSKAFYGVVFGWDFHSIGSGTGRYTLIENRGRNIGGLHFRPKVPGSPQGGRWLSLLSVDDPAAAARYVETHGGKVIVAPTVFEGRGTHALFRDDDGAVFGVLKSDTGDPPDAPPVAGEFLWLDLFARDPKKAAEFYRGLAGYDVAAEGDAVPRFTYRSQERRRHAGRRHCAPQGDGRPWLAAVRPGGRRRGDRRQGDLERRQSAVCAPARLLRGPGCRHRRPSGRRGRPREPDRGVEERTR